MYGIVAEDYPKTLMELEGRFSFEDACLGTVYYYERSGVLHGLLQVWGFTVVRKYSSGRQESRSVPRLICAA